MDDLAELLALGGLGGGGGNDDQDDRMGAAADLGDLVIVGANAELEDFAELAQLGAYVAPKRHVCRSWQLMEKSTLNSTPQAGPAPGRS